MNFRVGQKVVCVDARPGGWGYASLLTKGAVYTVAAIHLGNFNNAPGVKGTGTGLQLEEVRVTPNSWFDHERFRPVVERKTDISIFTKMLTDTREPVGAR